MCLWFTVAALLFLSPYREPVGRLPINLAVQVEGLRLTTIGAFGIPRKARPDVKAHLHTGIDIMRPIQNYKDEPVFAVANGVVISVRKDGAYSQLIVRHLINGEEFWTNYEHIAGIRVMLGDNVGVHEPIARFMSKEELDKYGWQFDHFHFEVLKSPPAKVSDPREPERRYASFSLVCKTPGDLEKHFYEPISFLKRLMR